MQYVDFNNSSCFSVLRELFKNLSESDIDYILKKSMTKKYYKNEIILNKENSENALYVLIEGIIQIGCLSSTGRFHAFHYFSQKHFINLLPCLKQLYIDYDYHAFNQVKVLIIPKAILLEIINKNNSLNIDFLDMIAFRMHQLLSEVKFLHMANLHQKLCRTLLNLAKQYGILHPLGTEIKLKISQHDLADLLSSSRQTINKEMKILMNNKVVQCHYESIILTDMEYFEKEILLV